MSSVVLFTFVIYYAFICLFSSLSKMHFPVYVHFAATFDWFHRKSVICVFPARFRAVRFWKCRENSFEIPVSPKQEWKNWWWALVSCPEAHTPLAMLILKPPQNISLGQETICYKSQRWPNLSHHTPCRASLLTCKRWRMLFWGFRAGSQSLPCLRTAPLWVEWGLHSVQSTAQASRQCPWSQASPLHWPCPVRHKHTKAQVKIIISFTHKWVPDKCHVSKDIWR